MRIDLADHLVIGDIVYNCFMDELVISSINRYPEFHKIFFEIVDTRLTQNFPQHNKASYDSVDLYLPDLEGECDEEKSWVNWAKDNKDFLLTFDHIETIKEIYKIGFGNGFDYKKQHSYEEMMQK